MYYSKTDKSIPISSAFDLSVFWLHFFLFSKDSIILRQEFPVGSSYWLRNSAIFCLLSHSSVEDQVPMALSCNKKHSTSFFCLLTESCCLLYTPIISARFAKNKTGAARICHRIQAYFHMYSLLPGIKDCVSYILTDSLYLLY